MSLLTKILGDPNEKYLKKLSPMVDSIRKLEGKYKKMSDSGLKGLADQWKEQVEKGKNLDEISHEVFAAVREAARRKMGSGHFDVQMIGAWVLHEGKISEMKTGEIGRASCRERV